MKQEHLLNGKKQVEKELTFWKMWENLPGTFPKMQLVNELCVKWGLSYSNAHERLKKEQFVSLKTDLLFLFNSYGIAFDFKERGFFLDERQYQIVKQRSDMESAKTFNLSKSYA